ncbi:arsenical pump-driving ATPase [Dehalogenimonas etheniformans]|uniref:Arsenical pump-driving ATPase n=1 Tax=Dehalogenimonas etheniformans TaxID=1536648 RepID=A0A2P5P6F1_9CHLR|nr:arsenical pump-driving ATPase [Dehalogenimonas etheniformans]PPD57878.1 arsenical pump-driving ATPase [Dehalogenimonas etheniformans]QNT75469.1 arsenical pump-driving ATPase [Dehalogenimonas etheniformans]
MITTRLEPFSLGTFSPTKYLFFTGKGGVGKTSIACAVAVGMADNGEKVLLISTDPASNLQDVFGTELDGKGKAIEGVPGLCVANLNPEEAARDYRESVIAPYRGKLPASVIANMEEQLSGSCTVEIAAFDQFSKFITDESVSRGYDHIIFDTAPTGHTLRMLQLPSAWTNFISESTHGASCLGQLAGLQDKKAMYQHAVENLADAKKTALVLVSRPEDLPLIEAERSSAELKDMGIGNQILIINGVMGEATDPISRKMFNNQQQALGNMPRGLGDFRTFAVPLRSYNVLGIARLRAFFQQDSFPPGKSKAGFIRVKAIRDLVEDLYKTKKKVIFTMGKGGVGKTTVAAVIALELANKGVRVHLTSTDPANHLQYVFRGSRNITLSKIDEKAELLKYTNEVLTKAHQTMNEEDCAYIAEDLRSPCTQEIAVFRAFAEIVDKAESEVVVIDTAPTGHTLLLLDSTLSYHREVQRTKGEIPDSVRHLLPRLRDTAQTEIVIVTLPEATPVFEAERLRGDLIRAGINNKWWVINQSLTQVQTNDSLLLARAEAEIPWINMVDKISDNNFVVIPWLQDASIQNLVDAKS